MIRLKTNKFAYEVSNSLMTQGNIDILNDEHRLVCGGEPYYQTYSKTRIDINLEVPIWVATGKTTDITYNKLEKYLEENIKLKSEDDFEEYFGVPLEEFVGYYVKVPKDIGEVRYVKKVQVDREDIKMSIKIYITGSSKQ